MHYQKSTFILFFSLFSVTINLFAKVHWPFSTVESEQESYRFASVSICSLLEPVQIEKFGLTQLQFKVGIGSFLSKVDSYCDFKMFSRFKTVVRGKVFHMFDFDLAFNETLI